MKYTRAGSKMGTNIMRLEYHLGNHAKYLIGIFNKNIISLPILCRSICILSVTTRIGQDKIILYLYRKHLTQLGIIH